MYKNYKTEREPSGGGVWGATEFQPTGSENVFVIVQRGRELKTVEVKGTIKDGKFINGQGFNKGTITETHQIKSL